MGDPGDFCVHTLFCKPDAGTDGYSGLDFEAAYQRSMGNLCVYGFVYLALRDLWIWL